MDMDLAMEMGIGLAAGGASMTLPMKLTMLAQVDSQATPHLVWMDAHMDMNMGFLGGDSMDAMSYFDFREDGTITYSSADGGRTWTVQQGQEAQTLPPEAVFALLQMNADTYEKAGSADIDGRTVTVYTGSLDGKYLQQLMEITGAGDSLDEMTNGALTTEEVGQLGQIAVTVSIDGETGLPLRYALDMTEMMEDLLIKAIENAMDPETKEGMDLNIAVDKVTMDITLSQFDSVPAFEIPQEIISEAKPVSSAQGQD